MVIFKKIKKEVRILGVDDGPFAGAKTVLVGAVFRGGQFMDGVLKTEITVDGTDAEEKFVKMVNESKFEDLRAVFTDGITFGGFNTINIQAVSEKTGLPVVAVSRKKPDLEKFLSAAANLPHAQAIEAAGPLHSTESSLRCTG